MRLSSQIQCACGMAFDQHANGYYRQHRRTCASWISSSARQQSLYLQYQSIGPRKGEHKWTQTAAVTMGVAYVKAQGVLPVSSTCKALYCLPDYKDIQRLFGTIRIFQKAIEEVIHHDTKGFTATSLADSGTERPA